MISIRRRLTRDLLIATILALTAGSVMFYFAARSAATEQFDIALRAKALAISTLTVQSNGALQLDFNDKFMRGFEDQRPRDFFQLWNSADTSIARSESLLENCDLPRRVGDFDDPEVWNLMLPTGRPGRAMGFKFRPKTPSKATHELVPELKLVVASDREELDENLWQLLGLYAALGVLWIGGTLWIIPRLLRRGLLPLDLVAEQTSRINAESLDLRLTRDDLPTELQPIAERLNDLLERLEQSFERERRFSADLAHELRTPLAELRAITESTIKWPDVREPSTDHEVLAIAQQMERLVTYILALARGEQAQQTIKTELITLDTFIQEVWTSYSERAAQKGLQVSLVLQSTTVPGDAALLRSILGNLFDNAVEYSPVCGLLTILAEDTPDGSTIQVVNSTTGLEPTDIAKLFDRFWRKEEARSGGKHFGLGLALARTFAAAMGWTLTAEFSNKCELAFTLRGHRPNHNR